MEYRAALAIRTELLELVMVWQSDSAAEGYAETVDMVGEGWIGYG